MDNHNRQDDFENSREWEGVKKALFREMNGMDTSAFVEKVMTKIEDEEESYFPEVSPKPFRWLIPALSLSFAVWLVWLTIPSSDEPVVLDDFFVSSSTASNEYNTADLLTF